MIGVSFYGNNMYMNPIYTPMKVTAVSGVGGVAGTGSLYGRHSVQDNQGIEKQKECQTCARRKYKDGSDEADVSFKTPGHISPEDSAAKVMAHEQEHVANARQEATADNKQLLSATVSLKLGVCPECGRTYVAGGETNTTMKTTTYNENNPYEQARKTVEGSFLRGMNVDYAA
ncbi:MAG: hypothetical protein J6D02_01995 [Lachnospira sp.]|nr:hypothetical protein [Lachnospira sp.]